MYVNFGNALTLYIMLNKYYTNNQISAFLYCSLHITFNVIFITVNKSLWLLLIKACFYIRITNELF